MIRAHKPSSSLSRRQDADRFGKSILRLVEFGDGFKVIRASAGEVLLCENVLQNDSDTELLPLSGQK